LDPLGWDPGNRVQGRWDKNPVQNQGNNIGGGAFRGGGPVPGGGGGAPGLARWPKTGGDQPAKPNGGTLRDGGKKKKQPKGAQGLRTDDLVVRSRHSRGKPRGEKQKKGVSFPACGGGFFPMGRGNGREWPPEKNNDRPGQGGAGATRAGRRGRRSSPCGTYSRPRGERGQHGGPLGRGPKHQAPTAGGGDPGEGGLYRRGPVLYQGFQRGGARAGSDGPNQTTNISGGRARRGGGLRPNGEATRPGKNSFSGGQGKPQPWPKPIPPDMRNQSPAPATKTKPSTDSGPGPGGGGRGGGGGGGVPGRGEKTRGDQR